MSRIAVIGAQYNGRGAVAEQIQTALLDRSLSVCRTGNLDDTCRSLGFPLASKTTAATAAWSMTAGAAAVEIALSDTDVAISEYAPVESMALWLAAVQQRRELPDPNDQEYLDQLASVLSLRYTLTLVIPFAPRAGSGISQREERFLACVDEHLRGLLDKLGVAHYDVPAGPDGHVSAVDAALAEVLYKRRDAR